MSRSGYDLLPTTPTAPTTYSPSNIVEQSWPRSGSKPRFTRLQPHQFIVAVPTLSLLFTIILVIYLKDPKLFSIVYPEKSLWASDDNNFDDIFLREARLPQHNLSAPYPEGKDGRFLRFSNQVWGLGWNNLLQERLLNTILAYESDRAPVFSPFEAWAHPPRNDITPTGQRQVLVIPHNALLSGPAAGGSWGPDDNHPRAINQKWWDVVCPPPRRKVISADEIMKEIGKESDGIRMLQEWASLLKSIPENCVEIVGTQVFDYLLIGSTRILSLWDIFSKHPTIQRLEDSDIVKTAVLRNLAKLQPQPRFARPFLKDPSGAIPGLVAIHIRRGDYLGEEGKRGHCLHLSVWGSTYSGWSQLPQLRSNFDPPPRGNLEWGKNTPEIAEYYLRRCLPNPSQVASRLHTIRSEHGGRLSRIFIATNAEESYLSELRVALVADGWRSGSIVTSMELDLNWQATSVSMAVDMAILSRAEVFVGNGFSSMTSNVIMRRLTTGMPPESVEFW